MGTVRDPVRVVGYKRASARHWVIWESIGSKDFDELREPGGVGGPGGGGDEVAVGIGGVDGDLFVGTAAGGDFGADSIVGGAGAAFEDAGGGENLQAMAD